MTAERRIVVIGDDALVLRGVERIAAERGAAAQALDDPSDARDPWAIVVDLARDDALTLAAERRARWPGALLAGFLAGPDRARWEAALGAGYDLVASRGSLSRGLGRALDDWTGPRRARRVRAVAVDDVAGRLGVVARLDDPEAGPIAVYHVGGALYATADVCPHAGAKLSEGALDGAIVTCPRHGSQFDVRSGERVRGPADLPVPIYRVAVEGGVAFIEVDAP
ncbi:MAG: Rieske 2Fe-2S domain-containing protein [Chloroflexota bacterium]